MHRAQSRCPCPCHAHEPKHACTRAHLGRLAGGCDEHIILDSNTYAAAPLRQLGVVGRKVQPRLHCDHLDVEAIRGAKRQLGVQEWRNVRVIGRARLREEAQGVDRGRWRRLSESRARDGLSK